MMETVRPLLKRLDIKSSKISKFLKSYTFLVYVFLYAPILIVIILSFSSKNVPSFPLNDPTLKWYSEVLKDERLISALYESIQLGIISAIVSGIVGILAAFGMVRGDFKSRFLDPKILNTLFLAPLAVPWVVSGIAVLILYSLLNIQGTYISLVLGHVLITIPFVVIVVSSQLSDFDKSMEEAAQNLGATPLRTFYEVTLPIISPGVIAGMLFAFTISFDNFTQTFFWVGGNTETLPIVIYSRIRFGIDPTINAIGTIVVLISLAVALIAEKLSSRVLGD